VYSWTYAVSGEFFSLLSTDEEDRVTRLKDDFARLREKFRLGLEVNTGKAVDGLKRDVKDDAQKRGENE